MIPRPRLAALGVALAFTATAQVALIQIRVEQGDGAVHAPGSRASLPLAVRVTDQSGKPVAGAAVSFHAPQDGPGGLFPGGLPTVVAVTGSDGRAEARGLRLNRVPGSFQIRIVASREQARAGVVSTQYIAEPRSGVAAKARSAKRRWWAAALLAGTGAAAGVLAAGASAPSHAATPAPPATPPSVGAPQITVGKP